MQSTAERAPRSAWVGVIRCESTREESTELGIFAAKMKARSVVGRGNFSAPDYYYCE